MAPNNNNVCVNDKHNLEKLGTFDAGRKLANPLPGEEIVITGMSGQFPDSHNIDHFKDNLYNKVDLISSDERHYKHEHPEIPKRGGKIFDVEKFDAAFFGVPSFQMENMDPTCRLSIEKAFEAIIDAGYHPSELEGTKTGVYTGSCISESESLIYFSRPLKNGDGITGSVRSMISNYISYFLKLNGPSIVNDTACSSSSHSFEQAYKDLREGRCDYAIVCGANLCLHPYVTLHFARLGVLSMDGRCKSFDNDADGYARSEGVVAVFLQKSKDARRIYAKVLHAKTNCDGFKEQGITYPSGEAQKTLLEDFYKEVEVSPESLSYMEAHGTGTKVGDPEELQTIDEVFCINRKRPLLIGSVKSNIGHNEPVSGLCSIVKVVIGMENGFIPPNLNFKNIRKGVEGLEKRRMIVVDEKISWQDDNGLVGINSFGFGGGNSHILLKWNEKVKKNTTTIKTNLPKLVCVSGRTPKDSDSLLNSILENGLDEEHIALVHQIYKKHINGHQYHAFMIAGKGVEICRSECYYDESAKPLYIVFGTVDKKWPSVGHQLFSLPIFAGCIERLHSVFEKYNVSITISEIINSYKADNLTHNVMGTVAVQLGLVETLKELKIPVEKSVGFSLGIIPSYYAQNLITFEEAAIISYHINLVFNENNNTFENQLKVAANLKEIIKKACQGLTDNAIHNMVDKLMFYKKEKIEHNLPKDCIICNVGFGDVQQKKIDDSKVTLVDVGEKDAVESLLEGIGKLYQKGVDVYLASLYPKVEFPVSRGTPVISSHLKWDHSIDWYVMNYKEWVDQHYGFKFMDITTKDEEWSYLVGHTIDGRNLFPATGYLCLVWNLLAAMTKQIMIECKVFFENVKFIRAVNIPKSGNVRLMVTIQKISGEFEVAENDVAVVTGRISTYKDDSQLGDYSHIIIPSDNTEILPLTSKDIYKELRLRGYNYSGLFKGIKMTDQYASSGLIEWKNNFTAFMDNMLQMKILQEDTRNLYVPTSISRIVIDPRKHLTFVEELNQEHPVIPVYANKHNNIIRTNFIEIRGLSASSLPRRKVLTEPVLETYKFIPNEANLPLEVSVRVCLQTILENVLTIKAKIVEVPQQNIDVETYNFLSPIFLKVLGNLPLMQPEITILTDQALEISEITVENKQIKDESNCLLLVVTNVASITDQLNEISTKVLRENGMILSRENAKTKVELPGFETVLIHEIDNVENLILFKKKTVSSKFKAYVKLPQDNQSFYWLNELKICAKNDNQEVILYSQDDCKNGILGLVNCLRREPNGEKFRAVFIKDEDAPIFDMRNEMFSKQIEKGLAINVFEDGKWGTYRHVLLEADQLTETKHAYAIVENPGDLSTLKWIQGTLSDDAVLEPGEEMIKVYYASINFRDVMTASGKISADVITRDRTKQMCVQGFEFAGKWKNGERVCGVRSRGALSNFMSGNNFTTFPIPDNWTLAESATTSCVYLTVLAAFVEYGKIKPGDTVLIHSGTGGVGQTAINVALHYGCTIFVTVGTQEKRDFIRANFPQIRETHIGNSRNTSFEQMVMYHTKGRGVDMVLNSLAEEKLRASVRCLVKGGKFLEIGKFDLANDNPLMLDAFMKGISFYSVMLDMAVDGRIQFSPVVIDKFKELVISGEAKPLQRTVFPMAELEQAFRYMATGKHIGKVMIKIREDDEDINEVRKFTCHKRYYSNPKKTTIIVGGLGGFGLELADWLVLRNARKIVLTSRRGVTTGYQAMRIRLWKSYGVEVVVSTEDVTDKEACKRLLEMANELGPVEAIFNLGVVLRDAILENQTAEDFEISFAPKAYATEYLDELTRVMCPELKDFVIFSSVSCGRGNAGQTNYGMANSIMERICEDRKKNGYPALAIEWGAVGDVGLVAEMQESNTEIVIGGTLQQRITSCLSVLDRFLLQDEPIVSSMVVAEKRSSGNFKNAIEAVANILGLRDVKTVSPHQTLPELGMDSIMGVEIKQLLETEYEIVLTPQEIRGMTFARIQELEKEKESGEENKKNVATKTVNAFETFLDIVCCQNADEANKAFIATKYIINDKPESSIVLVPGVEGFYTIMQPLASNLTTSSNCLQYIHEECNVDILETARSLLETTKELIGENKSNFRLVAYSYGVIVALELINLLEQEGYLGKIIFVDGSPDVMKELCLKNLGDIAERNMYDTKVLCMILSKYISTNDMEAMAMQVIQKETFEEKVEMCMTLLPKDFPYTNEALIAMAKRLVERLQGVVAYSKSFDKIKSVCKLVRPNIAIVHNYQENYFLDNYCENLEGVEFVEGDHISVLGNVQLAEVVDKYFKE